MERLGARTPRSRAGERRRRAQRGAFLPADVPTRVRQCGRRPAGRLRRRCPRDVRRRARCRVFVVSPTTIQRTIWLAAITLIVAVAALAFARRSGSGHPPIPGAVGPYYTSRAAPYGPGPSRRRTACGEPFTSSLRGIAHPTLPCGVKVYLLFRG